MRGSSAKITNLLFRSQVAQGISCPSVVIGGKGEGLRVPANMCGVVILCGGKGCLGQSDVRLHPYRRISVGVRVSM